MKTHDRPGSLVFASGGAAFMTVALICFAEAPAYACSYTICMITSSVSPRENESIPANAPALVLLHSREPQDAHPELFADSSTPVAATVEYGPYYLIRPDAPLQANVSYFLQYREACLWAGNSVDAGFDVVMRPIHVTEARPLPTQSGTLSIASQGVSKVLVVGGQQCSSQISAATARIEFQPSEELVPFMPVTRIEVTVDGEPWNNSPYGSLGPSPPFNSGPSTLEYRDPLLVFAACETTLWDEDRGLTEGAHVVSVRAHVAGAADSLTPAEIKVTLSCGSNLTDAGADSETVDAAADAPDEVDGDAPDEAPDSSEEGAEDIHVAPSDSAAEGAAPEDAASDGGAAIPGDEGSGCSGSCATSRRGPGSWGISLACLALAAWALMRPPRSRRSS